MSKTLLFAMTITVGLAGLSCARAADLPALPPETIPAANIWTFRLTPYAWLTSLNGTQTVKGRTADVNATFPDIINTTFSNGGTLAALMLDAEARNGPYALFGDVVWERITLSPSGLRSRSPRPEVTGILGAALNTDYNMVIVDGGAGYEFARLGPVAFDFIAGARYWHQNANLDLSLSATLDVRDLSVSRDRAIARSGSVDWVDGFAGARARVALAPGQELFLRGDLGGGGSKFSWQAVAAYSYDFASRNGVTYSGVLGYRALYVDYEKGSARSLYRFDMLQHGPVVGLNVRF